MSFLPADVDAQIERSVPIACVDVVLARQQGTVRELGLIRRDSPFGEVWCHLGGRIQRGETIDALPAPLWRGCETLLAKLRLV